jgi:hypothetical protein
MEFPVNRREADDSWSALRRGLHTEARLRGFFIA